MTVTSFQVQKVLRTYGRQLSRSRHLLRHQPQKEQREPDSVNISTKARRLHLLQGIASDMIGNMGRQDANQQVEQEAIAQLSQAYGEPLAIVNEGDGSVHFAVMDPEEGLLKRHLSREESKQLQLKLSEITMEIIDQNMMGD